MATKRTTSTSRTSPAAIRQRERVAEALDYRRQGHAYAAIALAMSVTRATAFRLVRKGLDTISREQAQQVFALEYQRLNELLSSVYPQAAAGDLRAVEASLDIMERIDRLCGLDKSPPPSSAVIEDITIRFVGEGEQVCP